MPPTVTRITACGPALRIPLPTRRTVVRSPPDSSIGTARHTYPAHSEAANVFVCPLPAACCTTSPITAPRPPRPIGGGQPTAGERHPAIHVIDHEKPVRVAAPQVRSQNHGDPAPARIFPARPPVIQLRPIVVPVLRQHLPRTKRRQHPRNLVRIEVRQV